ncbi:MAG: archaeoflavoprotein AfpA [Candidatus Thorarchaeota archaeon]
MITLARIVWGITGSGDLVSETFQSMKQLEENAAIRLTVIVSKAGEQMLRLYGRWDELTTSFSKVMKESNANVPFLAGPLQIGKFDALVVAPLTANSTAKIAHGIADTLITNAVAQTLKGTTPVILFPVDQVEEEVQAIGPKGEEFTIKPRKVDLDNVRRLREMERVTVVSSPLMIPNLIADLLKRK